MFYSTPRAYLFLLGLACGSCGTGEGEPPTTERTNVQAACPTDGCTTIIFADGFSHGLTQWVESGDGDFTTSSLHEIQGYEGEGAPVAHASDCDVGCTIRRSNIDLSKASGATLKFRRFVDSLIGPNDDFGPYACAGEYCAYLAKWTGNSGDDNVWHDESFDLAPFVGAPSFDLRFIAKSSSHSRVLQIDDVEISIHAPICGDQICESPETCAACATDCGICTPNTIILSDNFDTIRRWTELGYGNWNLSGLGLNTHGYPATAAPPTAKATSCLSDCIIQSAAIDLSFAGSASVSVWRFVDSNLGPGEYLKVDVSGGDGFWETIAEWTHAQGDNRTWTFETLDVSTYARSSSFQVRFVAKSNSINDNILIDNFAVTAGPNSSDAPDRDGDRLPDAVETNTLVYVDANNTGTDPDRADTDGDFLFDGDEVLVTPTGLNLRAMGANPLRRNILVEFDWFEDAINCDPHSHRPTQEAIDRLVAAFADAPRENPDGSYGITLIADFGQGGFFVGGNTVADANGGLSGHVRHPEFDAIKAANFATARERYFHYALMPHFFDSGHSGAADINGDDMVVSLGCSANNVFVANTLMHELGHNLGLRHGGFENRHNKPNYNSVMNYRYQLTGVDTDCDSLTDFVLDYSRGTRIDLYEPALVEIEGVCGFSTIPIDWNMDGDIDSSPVTSDLDGADGTNSPVLEDFDDWGALNFDGIARPEDATVFGPERTAVCSDPRLSGI